MNLRRRESPERRKEYVAAPLLRELYVLAAPSLVAQPPRVWRWPPSHRRLGVTVTRRAEPPIEPIEESIVARLLGDQTYLLLFARSHLKGKARPVAAAKPGDYLHVPQMRLALYCLPASAMGATAVWMHGVVDDARAGR